MDPRAVLFQAVRCAFHAAFGELDFGFWWSGCVPTTVGSFWSVTLGRGSDYRSTH